MFERFTKDAREAVLTSTRLAADHGADKVGPEHLLLALAVDDRGPGNRILAAHGVTASGLAAAVAAPKRRAGLTDEELSALRAVGIDAGEVFRRIEEAFGSEALDEPTPPEPRRRRGRLGGPFGPQAKKVLELSLREAITLRHRHIGSEHLLLALLRQGLPGSLSTLLGEHRVTYDNVRQRVLTELDGAA